MGRRIRLAVAGRRRERELAADRRTGRYARSKALRRQRTFLRRFWPVVAALVVLPDLLLPVLWLAPRWSRAFAAGLLVSAGPWRAAVTVVVFSGSLTPWMGRQGEAWTAGELRRLRRQGWRVMNGAFLSAEIDHLALGPPGVLVLETKWAAEPWDLDRPGSWLRDRAVDQVRTGVRDVARILHNHRCDAPVLGAVVLWHPPTDDVGADVCQDSGMALLTGSAFRGWIANLPEAAYDRAAASAAWADLEGHLRRRDRREVDLGHAPPRTLGQWGWSVIQAVLGCVGGSYAVAGAVGVLHGTTGVGAVGVLAIGGLLATRVQALKVAASAWSATVIAILVLGAVFVVAHRV